MRQIVLDTETTGLSPKSGHRIIEIGCVELVNRQLTGNHFHYYIQPDREIDPGAQAVHGITAEFLADKPRFHEIAQDFINYVDGSELIIHNAAFDMGFLDHEINLLNKGWDLLSDIVEVVDTLKLAREKHPGQKNNLDALCKRYSIDNSKRDLHGALLDAEILSQVYLVMTGGQTALDLSGEGGQKSRVKKQQEPVRQKRDINIPVVEATEEELKAHEKYFS